MIRTSPMIIAIMVASSAPVFPDDARPEQPNGPTLIDLSGQSLETREDLDGCSLVPLLADPENRDRHYSRDTFYWHYPFNVTVVNSDDGHPAAPHSTICEGDWKLLFDWSGAMKLYNIALAPFERDELSARQPEKARELFRKLNDWIDVNVAVKYLPALNPDYVRAQEVRDRPFDDERHTAAQRSPVRHLRAIAALTSNSKLVTPPIPVTPRGSTNSSSSEITCANSNCLHRRITIGNPREGSGPQHSQAPDRNQDASQALARSELADYDSASA